MYTFIAFFPLVLIFAVWSNVQIYAQSPPTGGFASNPTSSELKSIMCDPLNPDLKVVNTTEARVCGIPKTVKPSLSAAPEISTVSSPSSSSPPVQQIATTGAKPTTPTSMTITSKPHQTVTSKNINAISPSTAYITWATISLLSNTSSLPSSTIAPQIATVSQQQQQPPPLLPIARVNSTTGSNNTAGQNYTFAAASPVPSTSDQLIYLGYHGDTKSSHGSDGSKHDDSSDSKRSSPRSTSDSSSKSKLSTTPRIKTISTDFDSIQKKKTSSSTKVDKTDHANDDTKPSKVHSTKTSNDGTSTAKKKSTKSYDGSSEDKSKSDSKLPSIKIIATDNHSTVKKKTATTNDESSSEDKRSLNTGSSTDHATDSLKKRIRSDTTDTIINDGVTSKGDSDSATKLSGHHARSSSSTTVTDLDSIEKNIVPSPSDDSRSNKGKNSPSDDGSESSLYDLGSTIRNKVHSIIRDSLGESGHSLFGLSDIGGF
jgi:hypothetical protein